jgi:exodeoxyribonuclease VII small subunit
MPTSHSEEKPTTTDKVKAAPKETSKDAGKEAGKEAVKESGEELGFDQILDRLRQVVQRLEQGNLPLEQALKAFEEGVRLSRRGSAILDAAEQRVELLLRDEDGSERRQPLVSGAASEARPGT